MMRIVLTASSAVLRERLRTLVGGAAGAQTEPQAAAARAIGVSTAAAPSVARSAVATGGVASSAARVEIAGETSDPARAHALASRADVLLVWGGALLSRIADQLDPDQAAHDDLDAGDADLLESPSSDPASLDADTHDSDAHDLDAPRYADVPSYAIVAIANDRRVASALESLPVRGWAVVPEDASREELAAALTAADAGLGAMPVAWTARPRTRALEWVDDEVVDERLTSREQEVLEWLSQGLSNRRIAERLGISEHTVKFHINAIYGKLGASTRTEAVNRALRRGWLRL
jgi:two-component system, NarL family, nitrate/nitrite response regulator NarL